MGADLIGYLVKGPVDPNFSEQNKRRYFRRVEELKAWSQNFDAIGTGPAWAENVIGNIDPGELADVDAEATWNAMKDLWEDGSRDCRSRPDPQNPRQVIMFCGEMSWGDDPDGFGYQTLSMADKTGLLDLLRIR